ncbi:MAG: hypothetical protein ACYTHM_10745 [Planctomycetota bacterium]|jgi:hypothetical protein
MISTGPQTVPSNTTPTARVSHRAWILTALLCTFLLPKALLAEDPESLSSAMKKKKVKFEAVAMHGFEKIDITLVNLTDKSLRLNPAGAVLLPPDPSLQRLGLGAPVDAEPGNEDSFLILLAPNGRWTGCVWAVCLDHAKAVPANGVPYTLSGEVAEDKALEILQYWAKNPWINQKTVNDLIWTKQDLKVLQSQVIPQWLRKSSLTAWGGELFWLSGEGQLFRLSGEKWVKIGEGFENVVAGHGTIAGTHSAVNGIRFRTLTGEGWQFKPLAGAPAKVFPGPGFVLYARVGTSLLRFDPGADSFVPAAPFPILDAALKRGPREPTLVVLANEPRQVKVRFGPGKWQALPGGAVKSIAVSHEKIYAELENGIYRFGKKWVKVAERGSFILPGRTSCFFFLKGKIRRYDESKKTSIDVKPLAVIPLTFGVDPVEDRLFAVDERGMIWAWEGESWVERVRIPEKGEGKKGD